MGKQAKQTAHLIYGVALILAGLGVFYRIPQVMPKILAMEHFVAAKPFLYFCFYLIGILLIGGGGKKIYNYFKNPRNH